MSRLKVLLEKTAMEKDSEPWLADRLKAMAVVQELKHGSHDFAHWSITFPSTEAHLKLQSYFQFLLIDAFFIPDE